MFQTVTRNKNLSPEAKAIYAYLCSFAGSSDSCYPSVEMMQDELGMSKGRFSKYMKELIAFGVVKKTRELNGNLYGRNIYRLTHEIDIVKNMKCIIDAVENQPVEMRGVENQPFENATTNNNIIKSNIIKNNSSKSIISSEPDKSAPIGSGTLLPLVDKTFYDVPVDKITLWQQAFPGVDVEQELRKMITWCNSNPKRKKTRNGADRFINNWLERAQNSGRGYQSTPTKEETVSTVSYEPYVFKFPEDYIPPELEPLPDE